VALAELKSLNLGELNCLVSCGTGYNVPTIPSLTPNSNSVLSPLCKLAQSLGVEEYIRSLAMFVELATTSERNHEVMQLLSGLDTTSYYRINPKLPFKIDLSDVRPSTLLLMQYLSTFHCEVDFEALATKLLAIDE